MSYLVPVYRYFHEASKDHFYTQNPQEIGTTTEGQTGNHGYKSEGVAFYLVNEPYPGLVPVTRWWHEGHKDHHYTSNPGENVGQHGYKLEHNIGHISPHNTPGTVPVYRYFNNANKDHLFTTNASEIGTTTNGQAGHHGYTCEGILGYAFQPAQSTYAPVYRYWHEASKDHFYTQNAQEIGTTTAGQTGNHGYKCEGIAYYASAHPYPGLVPVTRWWHEGHKDHHYTANPGENISQHGYKQEGVLGHISPQQYPGTVPIFRYYNGASKDHLFTTNASEIGTTTNGHSGNHGYTCEGILGYSFAHH